VVAEFRWRRGQRRFCSESASSPRQRRWLRGGSQGGGCGYRGKARLQGQGRAKARKGQGEGHGGARGGGARAQETKARRGLEGRVRRWLQQ
jgi:hypothetical protein